MRKAHRVQKAERIIRQAYGITRDQARRRPVRYELLGTDVAVVVLRDEAAPHRTAVKVARLLPDGCAKQMRKASRSNGFTSIKDQITYFETMYECYGAPE